MNIEDLTIGQAKQLAAIFGVEKHTPSIASRLVGIYVIARCYSAGVHAGTVESIDGENVTLRNSRRLWQWKAKDGIALSGLAQSGLKDGKVDTVNPFIYLTGVCELIPCSAVCEASINEK